VFVTAITVRRRSSTPKAATCLPSRTAIPGRFDLLPQHDGDRWGNVYLTVRTKAGYDGAVESNIVP
jgi:hypothetical protein